MLKGELESPRENVRALAIEVAQQLHAVVGDMPLLISYLPRDLNPQTRDHLIAALEQGGQGGGVPGPGVSPSAQPRSAAASRPPTMPPSPPANDSAPEELPDENTCQFCGIHDPAFSEEKLDLHFWKECPMLMPCEQCGQIVEVVGLNNHILTECDQSQPFRYQPPLGVDGYGGCPLCGVALGDDFEAAKRHLAQECEGNIRRAPAPPVRA